MKKNILLVGGSREMHPKLKKYNLDSTLLFDMATVKSRKNLDQYTQIVGLPKTNNVEAWIEIAKMLHAYSPFQALGGFNEPTQEIASQIAESLGLSFPSLNTILLTKDKEKMRKHLASCGLDSTPSQRVSLWEDLESFARKYSYPIILKPVDGRGSLAVFKIENSMELKEKYDNCVARAEGHEILAEKFLVGPEWSVEAFSEGGVHKIVCVTQKFKDENFVENGHCLPALISKDLENEIKKYVENVLSAVGLENGPSHTEVITTSEGPRVVETHARLAGDSIVELIELATGVDLDHLWIRQTLGESVLAEVPQVFLRSAAIAYKNAEQEGILKNYCGIESAEKMEGIQRIDTFQSLGSKVGGAFDSFSRGAAAIAVAPVSQEAYRLARESVSSIGFEIV